MNGGWVHPDGGATIDVTTPADGTVVARIANGAGPEIQRAVTAAHAAFREWSSLPPKDRGSILLKIQALMQERRDGPGPARGAWQGERAPGTGEKDPISRGPICA